MKISNFKLTGVLNRFQKDTVALAEIDIRTGMLGRKKQVAEVRRSIDNGWRFSDTGKRVPDEINALANEYVNRYKLDDIFDPRGVING